MVGYEETITILGALGVGTVIATSLTCILDKRKHIRFQEHELEETRYKCIIVIMRTILKPDDVQYIQRIRPDLQNIKDLKNEIEMEWYNSWLFASDEVIRHLKEFILKPNYQNYGKTVLAMRKDLWNKKTELNVEECNFK